MSEWWPSVVIVVVFALVARWSLPVAFYSASVTLAALLGFFYGVGSRKDRP